MKIAAATFGCKINQYETSCILDDFIQSGWEHVPFSSIADIYLINTCTVTNRTDYKSRNAIRKALKQKNLTPHTRIVVTGCYSQLHPQDINRLGKVDFIIDNNSKNSVYKIITENSKPEFKLSSDFTTYCEHSTRQMFNHSRAFIKIQDGCSFFCAYCAVAPARGNPRSRKPQNILKQINLLTEKGYSEFVLGGVNLGLYASDSSINCSLTEIIKQISALQKVKKIRLSSLEPQLINSELLSLIKSDSKICPHFHLPLQSGSDDILVKMGRHYNKEQFLDIFYKLLQARPDAAIGLDVIAGLPGETENHFSETYKLLESLPLAYLHVFPYSRRPGTKAFNMLHQIHGTTKKERVDKLLHLSTLKRKEYSGRLIEDKILLSGIVEKISQNQASYLSDHFLRGYISSYSGKCGNLYYGKAVELFRDGVLVKEA